MKKLFFLIAFILTVTVSYSQKKTSADLAFKIDSIINHKMVPLTPELKCLIQECSDLYVKEQGKGVVKTVYMLPIGVCYMCGCDHCGCGVTQGNCRVFPSTCGKCPCCGGSLAIFVSSCAGSPCGSQQGAN